MEEKEKLARGVMGTKKGAQKERATKGGGYYSTAKPDTIPGNGVAAAAAEIPQTLA